jgi:predicted enzyme related to lactoylglutathione lyase
MAMGNAVVHFEIGAADPQPLVNFYEQVFGWDLKPMEGGGYTMIDTRGGGGINGGIGPSQTGEPWSTFYVAAPDLQAVLDKASSLGATTAVPVTNLGGVVTFAMFNDPDGLLVGLVQAGDDQAGSDQDGDDSGRPSAGSGAPVDWFEVLGTDAARSQRFYGELFGWNAGEGSYGMVDTGAGYGIQGGIGAGQSDRWATVYASVPDVEDTLARAEKLGGGRIYGPLPVDDHMQTGALRDPAGNVFGVYHHGEH